MLIAASAMKVQSSEFKVPSSELQGGCCPSTFLIMGGMDRTGVLRYAPTCLSVFVFRHENTLTYFRGCYFLGIQ